MSNDIVYLGMALVIFCWVITPFLRKSALKNIPSFDMFVITQSVVLIYTLLIVLYMKLMNKYKFISISNLSKKELCYTLLGGLTTCISSFVLIWLLRFNEVTYILPQLQPLIIVLTVVTGTCLFGENINGSKIFGLLLIIFGVYILNKFK